MASFFCLSVCTKDSKNMFVFLCKIHGLHSIEKVKLAKTNLLFPFFKVHPLNACAVARFVSFRVQNTFK